MLVKTTGIFCRPICRARVPLEKNVDYAFSSVEALHKGYRPCLRCRPDSAPTSFAWLGTQTTLLRACKLMQESPQQSIQTICERLGISVRYLHKLFAEKLKISPKKYQLYLQLLMAKNLLHQTHLSVENIAQSAGFTNSRQLQKHCKQTLDLTPTQIRNLASQQSKEATTLRIFLAYRPPYNWPALRDFLKLREISENENIQQASMQKYFRLGQESVLVDIQHSPEENGFYLTLDPLQAHHLQTLILKVQQLLDLHAQPDVIGQALAATGLSDKQFDAGLRVPGVVCRFEAACRAVLGQQVSIKAAVTHLNRLQKALSSDAAFPLPQDVANSDLAFLKMPERRKQALRDLAQLLSREPEADYEKWLSIKGIGPWTCQYVQMRTHESTDIYLATDLIIKRKIEALKASNKAFNSDKAAPWRSYLTFNLWNFT